MDGGKVRPQNSSISQNNATKPESEPEGEENAELFKLKFN